MTVIHSGSRPQIMICATPRSGSTLFTRCLSNAVKASAIHEPQIGITLNKIISDKAYEEYHSNNTIPEKRAAHHEIYSKVNHPLTKTHLKHHVKMYPIRKEMSGLSNLDMQPLKEFSEYDYNNTETKDLASAQYFADLDQECSESRFPIIFLSASPMDVMHSVFRSMLEFEDDASLSKERFKFLKANAFVAAKISYKNIIGLKNKLEERGQSYIEVKRDEILNDLVNTTNRVIELTGISGEASEELAPVKLYDGTPPSSEQVEYNLEYNDAWVSAHERSHNYFIPRTEDRSLSERLKEMISRKISVSMEEVIPSLESSEKKLMELYETT